MIFRETKPASGTSHVFPRRPHPSRRPFRSLTSRPLPLRSLRETLPLTFAATSIRLMPDGRTSPASRSPSSPSGGECSRVGLASPASRSPSSPSGGECSRVGLAAFDVDAAFGSLAMEPRTSFHTGRGAAIRLSQTVRVSSTVTFTVFTEISTQSLASANAFGT
jgi:hypothetical protein